MRSALRGLMVIATRRPPQPGERDLLSKVLQDTERSPDGHRRLLRVTVAGLDVEETHELAGRHAAGVVDLEFSRLLHRNTAGHPFFIEQVLRGLGDADLSAGETATAALRSLAVPPEVQEFIDHRLADLGPDAGELLEQAAVCGTGFRVDVLADLRTEPIESIIARLAEPVAAGLLVERGIGRFAFSHALVRETLF